MNETPHDTAIPALPLITVPGSTSIAAYGYDAHNRILDVKFVSGSVHRYAEVPLEILEGFKAAESKGSYFARIVRGQYASVPIPKALPADPQAAPAPSGAVAWPFPSART